MTTDAVGATPSPVVAVVGLGLMGGSLCRALRESGAARTILGIDPDLRQGARALEAGAVDRFEPDSTGLVGDADVIVYSAPLRVTMDLMHEDSGRWKEGALVTDLVSLKAPLLKAAGKGGFAGAFVGAHPICGGEGSGFERSRSDLFRGARIWLCAQPQTDPDRKTQAEAFWRTVGGEPAWMDAEEHDRMMAWVSHLPQLVANALAGALDAAGYRPSDLGPGGRDMTRLAGSNPELWKDLLEVSAPVVGTGLTSVGGALQVLGDLLARRDIDRIAEFMERTRVWREDRE